MKLEVEKRSTTPEYVVSRAMEGVHRVRLRGRTIGYVVEAGPVYVALQGEVYNTSYEVGQTLDLRSAVQLLPR